MQDSSVKQANFFEKLMVYIKGRSFLKNIFVLAGSTAFAQIVMMISSPILTRLYTPEDFGVLSTFISTLSIISVIGSLRYELAIPLPKEEKTAVHLLYLSFFILAFMTLVISGMVLFFGVDLLEVVDLLELKSYLWLLPIGVLGIGIYQIFNYWAIRKGKYKIIARTKLTQIIAQVVTQIIMGLARFGTIGLLIGDVIGRVGGSGTLITSFLKKDKKLLTGFNFSEMRIAAGQYKRFPLYSSLSSLVNTAGLQLPLILFTIYYGTEVAGFFSLSQRIIGIPMLLVGQAVSQVYFGEASRLVRENPKGLYSLFMKLTRNLFFGGLVPIGLLALIAPWLFGFVFGSEWYVAGEYTRWLAFMFLLQLMVVPLSQTLNVLERQDLQLVWDITRLVLVISGLYYAKTFNWEAKSAVILYGILMLITYLFLFILSYLVIRRKVKKEGQNG